MSNYPFSACPYSTCPFYIALSPRGTATSTARYGLFAGLYFPCGSNLLQVTDKQGRVTTLGAYINHTVNPYATNVMLHQEKDGSWWGVTISPVYPGQEILVNYNHTPNTMRKT